MATGSGKSRAAVFAAYELFKILKKKNEKLLVIISVPDKYLVEQWYSSEVSIYSKNAIRCHSEIKKWREYLSGMVSNLNLLEMDHGFVIGTSRSLDDETLNREVFSKLRENVKTLFIGDEAHSLGAPTGLILIQNINPHYRIGLTATPYRAYDESGTKKVLSWFLPNNQKIHEFSLKDAQDIGNVMKFNYHIYECEFIDTDFDKFIKLSQEISKYKEKAKNNRRAAAIFTIITNKRADLIKKCENKIPLFKQIIYELVGKTEKNNKFWKTVIYCRDKIQRNNVELALKEIKSDLSRNFNWNEIDGEMLNPDRKIVIDFLTNNEINAIIAMKCLDQGVDIPSLEKAIFVSSSGSDLEHIQRAGRILRTNDLKEEPANIYDIIVLPTKNQLEKNNKIAKKIYKTEKKRIEFFLEYAENKLELQYKVYQFNKRFL